MTDKPFLLIKGELVQQTSASFGGNGDSDWVDHVLCRDGLGRHTLRGETLAGALLATARRVDASVAHIISDKDSKAPSVWRVFTSHPTAERYSEVRQNVRIHAQTGAAADGALFDMETLPAGTRWPFLLEIDLTRCEAFSKDVLRTTLQALDQWQRGHCWLGRSVARGTGWFTLANAVVIEADWDQWPNSEIENTETYLAKAFNNQSPSLEDYRRANNLQRTATSEWGYVEYRLRLRAGAPRADSYGVDFLSVGGHAGDALLLDIQQDLIARQRLLIPQAKLKEAVTEHWVADQVFAHTKADGQVKPYIPGSSIRGVLRHAAQWWAQKHRLDIAPLERLFGAMQEQPQAGALLISDAHLAHDDWQAVLLKMHAEDEFAGGVYASALFDRLALTHAEFSARLVLEAKQREIDVLKQALQPALALAEQGFVGLGGLGWRGFGRLHWQIEPINEGASSNEQ